MKKEIDLSLYQFTEEERLIIEHEKELLKEKRKLFFATTIMMVICLTLLLFQIILLFRFIVNRPELTLTGVTSYIIIALVSIPLTIFSIVPLITSIFCMRSTNKIISRVSLAYLITSIIVMILNIVYIFYLIITVISLLT
ncbi:MAG: hypothetical protein IJW28_00290 [Clostridia bacterium]|nr:hypothetical protein [Clostridia bacterium]